MKTGKLILDSIPAGATIELDGRPLFLDNGEPARTPSDLTSLQYGTFYRITLRKEGYAPFDQVTRIGEATNNMTINPRLEPLQRSSVIAHFVPRNGWENRG